MADVTGPTTTLPGSGRAVPNKQTCDDCGAPATHRLQGETDSMGAEWADLCDSCYDKERERIRNEDRSGECEWCAEFSPRLFFTRDTLGEGLHGPVYQVCSRCIKRRDDAIDREYELMLAEGDFDEW